MLIQCSTSTTQHHRVQMASARPGEVQNGSPGPPGRCPGSGRRILGGARIEAEGGEETRAFGPHRAPAPSSGRPRHGVRSACLASSSQSKGYRPSKRRHAPDSAQQQGVRRMSARYLFKESSIWSRAPDGTRNTPVNGWLSSRIRKSALPTAKPPKPGAASGVPFMRESTPKPQNGSVPGDDDHQRPGTPDWRAAAGSEGWSAPLRRHRRPRSNCP